MKRKTKITALDSEFKMMLVIAAQHFRHNPFTPKDLLNREMPGCKIVATIGQVRTALDEIAHSTGTVQRWHYRKDSHFVCTLNQRQPEDFRYKLEAPVITKEKREDPTMVIDMWVVSKVSGFNPVKWRAYMERDVLDGHTGRYLHLPVSDEMLLAFGFKEEKGFRAKQFTRKDMSVFKYGARTYFTMGHGSDMRHNPCYHMGHVQEDYLACTGGVITSINMDMTERLLCEYGKSQKTKFFIK